MQKGHILGTKKASLFVPAFVALFLALSLRRASKKVSRKIDFLPKFQKILKFPKKTKVA